MEPFSKTFSKQVVVFDAICNNAHGLKAPLI